MCVYCVTGDEFFRDQHPPVWPYPPPYAPILPQPVTPPEPTYVGWPVDKLKELLAILEGIKKLEDSVNKCPCVPAKADYITLLKKRIEALEMGLEICPACKRWYAKPQATSHTRIKCLEVQLEDAKQEEALGQLQSTATTAGTGRVQNVQASQMEPPFRSSVAGQAT